MKLLAAAFAVPAVAGIVFLASPSSPSLAQEGVEATWVKRVLRTQCIEDGTCYRRYYYQRRAAERARRAYYAEQRPTYYRERYAHRDRHDHRDRYAERRGPQVRGYTWRDSDERDRSGWCRDMRRVVGNQHLTVNGAKAEADKAWIQSIRFYYGEVFMSLENAKEVRYTCSRSSVGETLGQTFNRCEIEARPCKAESVESAEKQ